jgi:uncharacterized membrane protein affecting hemolysin expression
MINLKGWATGLNWQVLVAKLIVCLVIVGGAYVYGGYRCKMDNQKQKTEQAEEHTRVLVKEVEKRVPVVQVREVESAKQRQEIKALKEKLDEALNNRQENPSCDLSDDEFNGVRALAEKANAAH